jgi:hypothetical protein
MYAIFGVVNATLSTSARSRRPPVRAARGTISVTVGELELLLPATGGSTPAFVEFPQAAVAEFMPDFDHQITALVDPDDVLADQNEGNNSLTWLAHAEGRRAASASRPLLA